MVTSDFRPEVEI